MALNEEFLTEEIYNIILKLENESSGMIDFIRANFDAYNFDEQMYFIDTIHDLEECLLNCMIYKLTFEKHFKKDTQRDIYRVVQDDTLVKIANQFYGDPTKWVAIYEANQLVDFDLTDVDTLIIPELDDVEDE